MGHYSIRKKVRDRRKEIITKANKNNFVYKTKFGRSSIDRPIYDKETGRLIASSASIGMRCTYVYNHKYMDDVPQHIKDEYMRSHTEFNGPGKFPQPKRYRFSQEKYIIKKMSHMDYLRGYAHHKMKKWDSKNPYPTEPDLSNIEGPDRTYYMDKYKKDLETHKKLRSDVFAKICTSVLKKDRARKSQTTYVVDIWGHDYKKMEKVTYFKKCFTRYQDAEQAMIENTFKYRVTNDGHINSIYWMSVLLENKLDKNGNIISKTLDMGTRFEHPRCMRHLPIIKVPIATGHYTVDIHCPYPEIANAA